MGVWKVQRRGGEGSDATKGLYTHIHIHVYLGTHTDSGSMKWDVHIRAHASKADARTRVADPLVEVLAAVVADADVHVPGAASAAAGHCP